MSSKIKTRLFCAALVFLAGLMLFVPVRPPTPPLPIKAAPFVWPEGCENKIYHSHEGMSCFCRHDYNRVSDRVIFKYRLFAGRGRGSTSYRLGSQIVDIGEDFSQRCVANSVIDDAYY